jgi:hypothetical protein
VQGIISDDPALMLAARAAAGSASVAPESPEGTPP